MFNLRSRFWERRWTAAIVAASMMPGRAPPALPAEGAALMARRLLFDIASAKNKPSVDFCGYC
jgi:hypothetical protein